MKTFNELWEEVVNHPDYINADIIDKEFVIDEVYNIIGGLTNYDLEQYIIDNLCEEWFEEHKLDIKKNFNNYFEMGEKYYYLRWSSDIITWLENKGIKTIPS